MPRGTVIAGPFDGFNLTASGALVGTLRYIGAAQIPTNLPGVLARMGQEPLNPPTVKGWDGGPTWINTSTMLARFNFVNSLIATTAPNPAIASETPALSAVASSRLRRMLVMLLPPGMKTARNPLNGLCTGRFGG